MIEELSTLMFTGNVTHKLDPKSRVAVPANWRAAREGSLLLIDAKKEGYPVVKCYTPATFAEMIATVRKGAESMGLRHAQVDHYVGKIIGCSFEAEVSSQGKLLIPKQQRENLQLSDTATLVGRGEYFEIWRPVDYDAYSSPSAEPDALDQYFGILS